MKFITTILMLSASAFSALAAPSTPISIPEFSFSFRNGTCRNLGGGLAPSRATASRGSIGPALQRSAGTNVPALWAQQGRFFCAVKRDGSTELDADLAVLKRHDPVAAKRDGSTEFDADLAVLERTVVDTTTRIKRDGSTEFDTDLAVL
ncbi:hypothetical protein B0T14DRAFT_572047 [Immersiella caudata]|uniref:Uncharacterized protein n=1 Tax=Immersiella caudata TaxID=314043 RepID=A0AA39U5L3_9PEZI|nr:hypothetical protein B0T14DRAFT_572047 [Immersiella caudata]